MVFSRPLRLALGATLAASLVPAACANHRGDCKRNPTLACFEGGDAAGGQGTGGAGGSATNTSSSSGETTLTASTTTTTVPPVPTLGVAIDRMGRPAISTALYHTFTANQQQKDIAKDEWNGNDHPRGWSFYVPELALSLAVLDSVDTICGNQLLADMTKDDPSRYELLATILSDDRLYVDTAASTCSAYLAVEAEAVGVPSDDCGGRRPAYDVIDVSYTILTTGKLDESVGDEIGISDAASGESFPHLLAPPAP